TPRVQPCGWKRYVRAFTVIYVSTNRTDHTDMEKQRRHQTAFISYALGGTKQYSGRSMEKAHAGLNLQPEHFDAIVKHLTDAIVAHGASQEDLDEALAKVATLKEAVLYK
ncbi:group 1 truncated hemoglobin, partial [Microcoleus sp. N9_B4]|uniref:group 1 truncated hemoglobin n=1 Tax=Microcoleus sp. N9_B4 TaxID=3055386 RepID=UPI002FD03236